MQFHRSNLVKALISAGLFALVLIGLSAAPHVVAAQDNQPLTAEFDATIAQDWMQLLYDQIWEQGVSAPAGSRLYAYAGVTLYEAVLGGMPSNNDLAGQLNDMPLMPEWDYAKVYDWPTVANEALANVYNNSFFEFSDPSSHEAVNALRDEWLEARSEEVSEAIINRSVEYGQQVAAAIGEWYADDGFYDTRDMEWEIPVGDPSLWVATNDALAPVEPYWGTLRPFGLGWADECAQPLNMTYSEEENSTFYQQALEVKEVGDDLTREQQNISLWWLDSPTQSGTPAGHWVMIESQLVDQLGLDLQRASEMYAMVGITLADSFISCWSLKYQINLMRPVTYIQEHIQRSWQSFVQTPMFPEYPSGHSVVSAAAADILTSLFDTQAFTDETHTRDLNIAPRHYTSFEAAANEAAISRLYGGIHYRTAIENGMRQGRCIAQSLLDNIQLNTVSQGE